MIFDALPGEHPDFRWVTKLIAYHGGRSGEFAQLRKKDVTISFGIRVLRLHDAHGSTKKVAKVADRGLSMHSFRHTWTTLAAEMNMPYAIAYAITGHTHLLAASTLSTRIRRR